MRKYSFLSTYIVVLIILYIGFVTTTSALVGNICTSATIKELNNVRTKGVKVKVKAKKWIPAGPKVRVKVDVGKKRSIRNVIIWAENVNGEHIGYWDPISAHVYVDGCNGPANSTISNQVDLNLSQITYEWNPPNAEDYKPFVTPTPSITQSSTNAVTSTSSTEATIAPNQITVNKSPAKSGSIIFKGVLQLMNHTDDDVYYFKSDVIKKSLSNNRKVNHILHVTRIYDSVPTNPPFSAAHYNNNTFNSLSVIALIVGFLIPYFL
ncbi:hypothetical protein RclHR1_10170005 [Rhizophagus clarus]|uniref:Reelin domain-containing protein n=1 Tax=Rhizophagus clarus TaxID=94130 RepID=A0A2Z6Q0W0_9GLOM|nr:hypothetical protein RclHR1_10170005 [Rhizophagus clarus]GES85079.1 hypothetical protein GLOIN_2v1872293 [Rhizophagus clarus]